MTTKQTWKFWELLGRRKAPANVPPVSNGCSVAAESPNQHIERLKKNLADAEITNQLLRASLAGWSSTPKPITIVEPGDKPTHFYVINGDTGQGLDTEGRQWVAREMASKIYRQEAAIIFANRAYIHDPSPNIFIEIHRAPRAVRVEDFR